MELTCFFCGILCETKQKLGGHTTWCVSNPRREFSGRKRTKVPKIGHVCACGKSFDSGIKLGGHRVTCSTNPNSAITKQKLSVSSTGRTCSPETRVKQAATINARVRAGTWHNSFSKTRVHEYAGHRFYGTWELKYAQWLDEQGIRWERVADHFEYEFDGKLRRYTPDFYLPSEGCYVEIKGCPTPKDFAKWDSFPLALRIITGRMLKNLGIAITFRSLDREYKGISWK